MSLKHQENPSPIPERPFQYEDIGRLRERLLHVSLLIGNVLALLAYIPSVVLLVNNKSWVLLALATFLYAFSLFLFVQRKLSYKLRLLAPWGCCIFWDWGSLSYADLLPGDRSGFFYSESQRLISWADPRL